MPWHQEPKKDVTSCDKPRGAANKHYIRGFPNGETHTTKSRICRTEYIGTAGERGELKHLSTLRKRDQRYSVSSGERKRNRPNRGKKFLRGFGQAQAILRVNRSGWEAAPKKVRVL